MLSIYHPDMTPESPPDNMAEIMRDVDAVNADLRAAGAWVFAGGRHPSTTATVLRAEGDEVLATDGPFLESREHIGGFWVIEAEDLDAALEWGRKATRACRTPVEVRPFHDEATD